MNTKTNTRIGVAGSVSLLACVGLLGCWTSGDDALAVDSTGESGSGESGSGSGEMSESVGDGDGDGDPGDGDGDPTPVDVCGDAAINGDEACDDGVNDGAYGGCEPGCLSLAEHCGDSELNGPEVCDDGVNDASYGGCLSDCLGVAAHCGDGEPNGLEECDDGANEDVSDGCFSDCTVPVSCLEIHEIDPNAVTGTYRISPKPGSPWEAECDMETGGGGWTGITLESTCYGGLDSMMTGLEEAPTAEIEPVSCRPRTRDTVGNHTYVFDIEFPPGFSEFYLEEYRISAYTKGSAMSEINADHFTQTTWGQAYGGNGLVTYGDVSFGSADAPNPVTSFAASNIAVSCKDCTTLYISPEPDPDPWFAVDFTTTFRIGWGEGDLESEGWEPWRAGTIFVR